MEEINFTTSVPSILEEIFPILKKRKLIETHTWSGWNFNLFFGPSLPTDKVDEQVMDLCFCMHADTQDLANSPVPTIPADGGATLITFDNQGIASWTYGTKEETFEKVNTSFNGKFTPRSNDNAE